MLRGRSDETASQMTPEPAPAQAADVPRLTVVVPTKNSGRTLGPCLRSVRAQTVPVQLIVVDNYSTDNTREVAEPLADLVLVQGPERSAQRNAGWRAGRGAAVAFIDSDMRLEPELAEQSLALLAGDDGLGAVVLPELAFGEGYFAACRSLEKRLYLGDTGVEAARVFRREALEGVGDYDERLTGPEDWELPDRVVAAGWRLGRTAGHVWHDEGRVRFSQQFSKKRYYGRGVRRYRELVPPERRRGVSRSSLLNLRALAANPLHAPGLVALKVVEAAGIAAGAAQAARGDRRTGQSR